MAHIGLHRPCLGSLLLLAPQVNLLDSSKTPHAPPSGAEKHNAAWVRSLTKFENANVGTCVFTVLREIKMLRYADFRGPWRGWRDSLTRSQIM